MPLRSGRGRGRLEGRGRRGGGPGTGPASASSPPRRPASLSRAACRPRPPPARLSYWRGSGSYVPPVSLCPPERSVSIRLSACPSITRSVGDAIPTISAGRKHATSPSDACRSHPSRSHSETRLASTSWRPANRLTETPATRICADRPFLVAAPDPAPSPLRRVVAPWCPLFRGGHYRPPSQFGRAVTQDACGISAVKARTARNASPGRALLFFGVRFWRRRRSCGFFGEPPNGRRVAVDIDSDWTLPDADGSAARRGVGASSRRACRRRAGRCGLRTARIAGDRARYGHFVAPCARPDCRRIGFTAGHARRITAIYPIPRAMILRPGRDALEGTPMCREARE